MRLLLSGRQAAHEDDCLRPQSCFFLLRSRPGETLADPLATGPIYYCRTAGRHRDGGQGGL